ncbi:MAG: type II toxin-antitoxin system RelE/ParE family toxin [Roseomonas sp.]|nr:type II toxin-antitoxin system RelE/ParE family toxin [Roseomonas sp.]
MRLVIAATARRDLTEAIAFIAADNPRAAERQSAPIQAATLRLIDFPGMGRVDRDGNRIAQVPGTPFRLVYEAPPDHILILRVWHGAREWPFDPR